jgi:pyridoxine 4-dehydrogenase
MTCTASAGTLRLADDLVLTRMGYGAIQLAGPMAWGPPGDREAAKSVLRAVVDHGITHIDTSDYYGPRTVNGLIRETLHPYPQDCTSSPRSAPGAARTNPGPQR